MYFIHIFRILFVILAVEALGRLDELIGGLLLVELAAARVHPSRVRLCDHLLRRAVRLFVLGTLILDGQQLRLRQ